MLSLVVITYNMRREAARTLHSLAVPYQRGVSPDEYEVLVIDNGSDAPLDEAWVKSFGPGFRYCYRESEHPSPAAAMNHGVRLARHDYLGLFVDGARMASPRLLQFAMRGLAFGPRSFVAALNWHLGPDVQWRSVAEGYCQEIEDRLLEESGWMQDGYQLFSVSSLAGANRRGYFVTPGESNALFLPRRLYDEVGGFEERFISLGGGHVNGDFFQRVCDTKDTELVILLGEGTFHQFHGGSTTENARATHAELTQVYQREYEAIRERPRTAPRKKATYLGTLPRQGIDVFAQSVDHIRKTKTPPTGAS